jgi:hypothetical protein
MGCALVVIGIWSWHVLWVLSFGLGIVGLAAIGTAFGKWRENRWLRPARR